MPPVVGAPPAPPVVGAPPVPEASLPESVVPPVPLVPAAPPRPEALPPAPPAPPAVLPPAAVPPLPPAGPASEACPLVPPEPPAEIRLLLQAVARHRKAVAMDTKLNEGMRSAVAPALRFRFAGFPEVLETVDS